MLGSSNKMKKWAAILVIIFLTPALIFFIYSLIPQRRVEKKYVLRDINTVQKLLLNDFIDSPDEDFVRSELDSIRNSLPRKFHRMEFFLKLQPVLSSFNDPNTTLIFGVPEYFPVLPFKARFIGKRLFVVESVDPRIKDGSEIASFNGMNEDELYTYLRKLVSADCESLASKKMMKMLFYIPFVERKEKHEVVFKNGSKIKVDVIPLRSYIKKRRQIYPRETTFDFKKEGNVGVLRVKTFDLYGQDIQDFEDLLDTIASSELKALVVDIRDCDGGDFRTAKKLFSHMISEAATATVEYREKVLDGQEGLAEVENKEMTFKFKPKSPAFKFPVFILVDRGTSNEALLFSYLAKKMNLAEIVGERPQQKLSFHTMPTGKWLPSVSMYISVSTAVWDIKGELEILFEKSLSNSEYLQWLLGLNDPLLEEVINELLKSTRAGDNIS